MAIELRWLVSTAASGLHAAAQLAQGATLVDPRVTAALEEPAAALCAVLGDMGLDVSAALEQLIPLSVRFDSPRQLAEVVSRKLTNPHDPPPPLEPLTRAIIALNAAFQLAFPRALEELELRAQPLCEQWEARGPGLIASLARLTEADLIVEHADVILVQPILGGAGAAHRLYNSAHIEAVLANPLAELPEVVRFGWLLAQLNLDLPKYQGELHRDRLSIVGPLALVPATLSAAEEVELVRNTPETLGLALSAWRAPAVDPSTLAAWWQTYQSSSPEWGVALAALDRMLEAE